MVVIEWQMKVIMHKQVKTCDCHIKASLRPLAIIQRQVKALDYHTKAGQGWGYHRKADEGLWLSYTGREVLVIIIIACGYYTKAGKVCG